MLDVYDEDRQQLAVPASESIKIQWRCHKGGYSTVWTELPLSHLANGSESVEKNQSIEASFSSHQIIIDSVPTPLASNCI
jgi:hypothetical protein